MIVSKKLAKKIPVNGLKFTNNHGLYNIVYFRDSQNRHTDQYICRGIFRHHPTVFQYISTQQILESIKETKAHPFELRLWSVTLSSTLVEAHFATKEAMKKWIKDSLHHSFMKEPVVPFVSKVDEEVKFASYLLKRKLEGQLSPKKQKIPMAVEDVLQREYAFNLADRILNAEELQNDDIEEFEEEITDE